LLTLGENQNPQRHAHDPLLNWPRSLVPLFTRRKRLFLHIWRYDPLVPEPSLASQLVGRILNSRGLSAAPLRRSRARPGRADRGGAGIGKSLWFGRRVPRPPNWVASVLGAGDELGQALPLLPILDGLRVREAPTIRVRKPSSRYSVARWPQAAARMCDSALRAAAGAR